jgi:putative alpha-1,2-mannosidase
MFSTFGFYPVNPPSATYVVGSPMFEKVTIHLTGRTEPLVIKSPGATGDKIYVKGLSLDGKPITKAELSHKDIMAAKELVYEMADTPQTWG